MSTRREEVAKTEIDNFDVAGLADENVFDFEITMDNAVAMAIVQGARDLTAELARLLLLQFAMRDDVVKHLAAIDVFAKHVPMIVGSDDVSHATNVRMTEKRDDSRLTGSPDFLRLICSLLICSRVVPIFC